MRKDIWRGEVPEQHKPPGPSTKHKIISISRHTPTDYTIAASTPPVQTPEQFYYLVKHPKCNFHGYFTR